MFRKATEKKEWMALLRTNKKKSDLCHCPAYLPLNPYLNNTDFGGIQKRRCCFQIHPVVLELDFDFGIVNGHCLVLAHRANRQAE